jgi:hypothetical protein
MNDSLPAVSGEHGTALQTHPRPHLRRAWRSLDGWWDFVINSAEDPDDVQFGDRIRVPYAPQAPASGLTAGPSLSENTLWYRTVVHLSADETPGPQERLLLHFGAVDWEAEVFLDGVLLDVMPGATHRLPSTRPAPPAKAPLN